MPTVQKHRAGALIAIAPKVAPAPPRLPWFYSTATAVPEIALFYGFSPLEEMLRPAQLRLERQDEQIMKDLTDRPGQLFALREKIALLRHYFARNPGGAPLAVFSERSGGRGMAEYHLDIIGSARPTAEALLMKLCYEVARQEYADDETILEINSVGERESFSRFSRDVTAHFRKHIETLHADCRQSLKKSPFASLACPHAECRPARESMPESVSFLSEPSRHHFMLVLEHLEAAGMPYSMDKNLIVEPDIVQHTVFRVSATSTIANIPAPSVPTIIARGSRWGGLGRRMGFKKDVLGASAIIRLPKKTKATKAEKKMQPPSFYFIHIGHDALLKSLNVIEDLRHSRIAVHHALLKDKMGAQLGSAESCGVPYIIIMGQKESVDGTAVVREMLTRSQETVPLVRLAEYLKHLRR